MKPQRSVFIETRLWFDKTGGNTYFSNRIWVDGFPVAVNTKTYGYGYQNEYTAIATLLDLGYDIPDTVSVSAWLAAGIDLYTSRADVHKAELWNSNTWVSGKKKREITNE